MKQSSILALTSLLSLVAAVPHNHKGAHIGAPHHKRAQVIHWDVETVLTTVTQWLPSGDPRLGHEDAQYTQPPGGDHSAYYWNGSPAESSATPSTTLTTSTTPSSSFVDSPTTSAPAAYSLTSSAQAQASSDPAAPVSEQQAAVVPVVSSTSAITSYTSETPTQVATTQAAYVAPAPAFSTAPSSSAAPESSAASYSSGGSDSSPMLGLCESGDPCYGDITTYTAGPNACGKVDVDSTDDVVALSYRAWEAVNATTDRMTGDTVCSFCQKSISVTLNGVTRSAKVTDKCMGCDGEVSTKGTCNLDGILMI